MSIRRMMLFTLGGFFKSIISLFKTRVLNDGGNFEAETNLENQLNTLGSDLFDSASLVITPNGVKTSKLYSIKPNDGTGDLSVVRNTSATRIDENGNIVNVPANVARIDYSNGSCPSILVEPQRTNLSLQSENLIISPWIYQNGNGVSTNDLNPAGQNYSNRINLLLSGFSSVRQVIPSLNNTTYTISCFFKKIPGFDNSFEMRYTNELVSPNTFNAIAFINPNTKTATFSLQGTNGTGISGSITGKVDLYPNDWFRVSMTFTSGSSSANVNALFRPAILINSTVSVLVWGAQLEVGSNVTSYIPTVASTVTRNADVISKTGIYTNNFITSSGGSFFIDLSNNIVNIRDTVGGGIWLNDSGNAAALGSGFGIRNSSSGSQRISIFKIIGGAGTTIYQTLTDNVKILIKWNGVTMDVFVNGVKVVNATSFTPTLMDYFISSANRTFNINDIAMFPTPITDAQAIQLTTL